MKNESRFRARWGEMNGVTIHYLANQDYERCIPYSPKTNIENRTSTSLAELMLVS